MLPLAATLLYFDHQEETIQPGKMTFFDALYVDYQLEEAPTYQRIRLTIHPKQDVVLKKLAVRFRYNYHQTDRIFCNGYQSWSESKTYRIDQQIPRLHPLARPWLKQYGDTHIPLVKRGKGQLHSWTYSYIQQNDQLLFIGSLLEQTGFTLVQHNTKAQELTIAKDCEGLQLKHSFPALDIWIAKGKEAEVFDRYFELLNCPPPSSPPIVGWTSWYHYYTGIDEALLLQNLQALADQKAGIDIFQIDDGYQQKVGDWLDIKANFPNGMANIARQIKHQGIKAGIWLAPFICEQASSIYKNKKSWLLKDGQGKPVKAGYNPLWSGWFYVLDFYNTEVQQYLTGVLHTVLEKWGFDLVKLDFLYATCILPQPHKTRGQVMADAMHFLRKTVGDKLILACGVPLGSTFGLADYCRIGADIHLQWEHHFLKVAGNRERVSTILSLRSTIGRWQLNGRAFHNDPDVVILRNEKNKLTPEQQYTILIINTLLGNVLFTSDDVSVYEAEQWAEWQEALNWKGSRVVTVLASGPDQYQIHFEKAAQQYVAFCNLTARPASMHHNQLHLELAAFETIILRKDKE